MTNPRIIRYRTSAYSARGNRLTVNHSKIARGNKLNSLSSSTPKIDAFLHSTIRSQLNRSYPGLRKTSISNSNSTRPLNTRILRITRNPSRSTVTRHISRSIQLHSHSRHLQQSRTAILITRPRRDLRSNRQSSSRVSGQLMVSSRPVRLSNHTRTLLRNRHLSRNIVIHEIMKNSNP